MIFLIAAIIVLAALMFGLGVWLGRTYLKPLPPYEKRLEDQIKEAEQGMRIMELHMREGVDVGILSYKRAQEAIVNKEIEELKNQKNILSASLEERKNELKNIQNSIDEWESSLIHQKIRILQHIKAQRQTEVDNLNAEYDTLVADTKMAITLIQDKMAEWSTAERIAYEERVGREETEKRNRLVLSSASIEELQELYMACSKLKLANPVPIYKAIYELYFRGPVKELGVKVGVVGKCGIYKITNTLSGKVYIGQSVDIAERWKQHIKRGTKCEVGTISGAGLYDAMSNDGVWNFSFEMLEECDKTKLNEREKFWIKYFQSNEIGYNQKL